MLKAVVLAWQLALIGAMWWAISSIPTEKPSPPGFPAFGADPRSHLP